MSKDILTCKSTVIAVIWSNHVDRFCGGWSEVDGGHSQKKKVV